MKSGACIAPLAYITTYAFLCILLLAPAIKSSGPTRWQNKEIPAQLICDVFRNGRMRMQSIEIIMQASDLAGAIMKACGHHDETANNFDVYLRLDNGKQGDSPMAHDDSLSSYGIRIAPHLASKSVQLLVVPKPEYVKLQAEIRRLLDEEEIKRKNEEEKSQKQAKKQAERRVLWEKHCKNDVALIDASKPLALPSDAEFFSRYRPYKEIRAWLKSLPSKYHGLATVDVIGHSVDGRELLQVKLAAPPSTKRNAPPRRTVFIQAQQHAREWYHLSVLIAESNVISYRLACPTTMHLIYQLAEGYKARSQDIRHLLAQIEFRIVPLANPDGYEYSRLFNRLHRKNMRRSDIVGAKSVDNNRNFPAYWGEDGASDDASSPVYHGPSAASEPETRAMMQAIIAAAKATPGGLIAVLDMHTYSELFLSPPGWTEDTSVLGADTSKYEQLGTLMSKSILTTSEGWVSDAARSPPKLHFPGFKFSQTPDGFGMLEDSNAPGVRLAPMRYKYQHSSELRLASGLVIDWVHDAVKSPNGVRPYSLTIELSPPPNEDSPMVGFMVSEEWIVPTATAIGHALLNAFEWMLRDPKENILKAAGVA